MRALLGCLLSVFVCSCIGTDFTNEPIGEDLTEANIEEPSISLSTGDAHQLNFQFLNASGQPETAAWSFVSQDAGVATVTNDGLVTGVGMGQTMIVGTAEGMVSDSVLVTVVANSMVAADVRIVTGDMNLEVGEQLQLMAEVRNAEGGLLSDIAISWMSQDTSIASIDQQGVVTGQMAGSTTILASADQISSLPYQISVNGASRSGTFGGLNGYSVSGTVVLSNTDDGGVIAFNDDFRSQSGPGLVIILSPTNSISGGINLGSLKSNQGAQEYPLPEGTDPSTFTHVFVHCEPFGLPFGVAQLQ